VSNPLFHIDLLKHYQVLERPGTFIVSVAYDTTERSLYTKDEYPRYIIPLRVIRSKDLHELIQVLSDETYISFYAISDKFLSGAIFLNDGIDTSLLPIKGEEVVATFDYKEDNLVCTHIKLIDRDDLMYVNLSAIDDLYQLAEKFITKNDRGI